MAGPGEMLRGLVKQALGLGLKVGKHAVREVATRIAGRIRDQVDLTPEPSAPKPSRPQASTPNLVVTPPPGGAVGARATNLRPAAAPPAEVASVASTPSADAPAAPASGSTVSSAAGSSTKSTGRHFQLFERVRVQPQGEGVLRGEIYEIHGEASPRFDVLTYGDDGRPRLLTGLEPALLHAEEPNPS